MCQINPRFERGESNLSEIFRTFYGCIESALLWYEIYKETLEKEGVVLNPYDYCVANKVIKGI